MEKFEYKLPHFNAKHLNPKHWRLKKLGKKKVKFFGGAILGLVLIFLVYQIAIFLINYPIYQALDHTQDFNPAQVAKSPDLATINNIIELPTDQNGTVAMIKDVKSLSQKYPAFKKARNGDVIIIYPDQYIIYDRENKTVVDISRAKLLQ